MQTVSSAPLPLIHEFLAAFPTRWPFPRGDLYHWIPLLNRFDNVLAVASAVYNLADGPQSREFGCDILLNKAADIEYCGDGTKFDMSRLSRLGYGDDGDGRLLVAILEFTSVLLENCGNRSIYASSAYLNNLLNSTSLTIVMTTLDVGYQLALRYQASVKRLGMQSRQVNTALLANHYNIDLDRVLQLAQPFVKTPIVSLGPADSLHATTPATPAGKSKEKASASSAVAKSAAASVFANDLVAIATPDQPDEGRWNGWGDIKVSYLPGPPAALDEAQQHSPAEPSSSSVPPTPTPLRRNSAAPQHRSPRAERGGSSSSEDGSSPSGNQRLANEEPAPPASKIMEISQHDLLSTAYL